MRQYKNSLSLVLYLLAALCLTACNSNGSWTTHTSEALGISVDVPAEWAVSEANGELSIANTEANLTASTIENGVGIIMQSESLTDLGVENTEDLLNFFLSLITSNGNTEVIQEPTTTTINGLQASITTIEGNIEGQTGRFTIAFIDKGNSEAILALLVDASENGEFSDTLNQVLQSIKAN